MQTHIISDGDVKTKVFTAQELRLNGELKNGGTPRTLRMFEGVRTTIPRMSVQRAFLFTESFKQTERQPIVLRWAKALKHIAENIDVYIDPDELIVGRPVEFGGRHAVLYPELDGAFLAETIEKYRSAKIAVATITDEDAEKIPAIAEYWKGKCYTEGYVDALPEETRTIIFGPDRKNYYRQNQSISQSATARSSQNWVVDYGVVLRMGFKGLKEEAEKKLAMLKNPAEIVEKGPFLKAMIMTCDSVIMLSNRYAKLAFDMAKKEAKKSRKAELEDISRICAWVPENPPRTFHEAVQAHWFTQVFIRLEQLIGGQIGNGRMDQLLQPFYKKDIDEGRITREEAIELLQCEWVHLSEGLHIRTLPLSIKNTQGFIHFEPVTLGGKTPDGRDATNEMSYLILDSIRSWPSNYPEVAVRIHSRTPDRFLHAACEVIKEGKGIPKLLNDEEIIPFYIAHGVSIEESNDYAASGCIESRLPNRENHVTGNGQINYGAAIEQTLRDGKYKKTGDLQVGAKTGDPRMFKTYDALWSAFCSQLEHMVKHIMIQQNVANNIKSSYFAAPLTSMLHKLAREQCKDLNTHDLDGALHLPCVESVGFSTAINSLAAMKRLVFEDKRISMDELLDALKNNFEGSEALRQLCLNAPKYGNADPAVDEIGRQIETFIGGLIQQYPTKKGDKFMYRCIPVTSHIPAGLATGATPDGRKAGMYLSEGIGGYHGTDTSGPSALLVSCKTAQNTSLGTSGGRLLNQKFSPDSFKGEEGTRRFMSYLRSWCDLKLWHIQFNIVNVETLRAAQKDPEKYRDLVIRVAGYSAYFTELTTELQQEIIDRTEHEL